jgi:NodT family efflux transporter outer membrane factor (OMF) lipoprotein
MATMFLLAALGAGCKVGPNYRRPPVKVESHFDELTPAQTTNSPVAAWWQVFHDAELDHLVSEALRGNLELQMAASRIQQSRFQRSIAAADLLPEVNADAGYLHARGSRNVVLPLGASGTSGASPGSKSAVTGSRTDVSPSASSVNPPLTVLGQGGLPGVTADVYQAGFDASWELDVFGGKRRSVEEASATLAATSENRRDLIVSLLAEVARDYLDLRATQERLEIARKNLLYQQTILHLIRSQRTNGLAAELDVARAAAQVNTTASDIPPLEAGARRFIHSLSTLVGKQPNELSAELQNAAPLPVTPPEIPVGLPSQLLERRPDIRAGERQIAAASARIGVAQADMFPKFALIGNAGLDASSPGNLFNWESRYFLISPTVSWRIFDAGRILSNVKLQKAARDETVLQYRNTILKALQEVEDALVNYGADQSRRNELTEAVRNTQLALDLAQQDYQHGLVDFLNVLEADRNALSAQDALVQASQVVCTDVVALYKALGGGWETAERHP